MVGQHHEEHASRVEAHVAGRSLNGFVSRAVDHELERVALASYLDELDTEFGPVPAQVIDDYAALRP